MAREFFIKETDIYKIIIEELNNSAFSDEIQFSLANWIEFGQDSEGNPKGLLINKLALNADPLSQFDVVETFNETTYASIKNSFVAFSVGGLNGDITALNRIKDVVVNPTLTFLVSIDKINVQRAITLALEEVRKRLIQYERAYTARYIDINNTASATKIEETLKVIMMSGTIDYGDIVQINSKQYLAYTMPLTMEITNFGEFANQQNIYLGVNDILDGGSVKMFLLEPDTWHWGTTRGVESTQLLPQYANPSSTNGKEIKSVVKNKGFAFSINMQMDFQDSDVGALCRYLYKDSIQEKADNPTVTLKVEMKLYDSVTDTFVVDTDLTTTRPMVLSVNQPDEELSKGEKLVHSLVLTPIYNSGS